MRERGGMLTRRTAVDELPEVLFDAEQRACIRQHMAVTSTGVRSVAAEIGLTRYRLERFLDGEPIMDRTLVGKVDAWCEGRQVPFVPPEEVAIQILLRWSPGYRRRRDRKALAEAILETYGRVSVRPPPSAIEAIRG